MIERIDTIVDFERLRADWQNLHAAARSRNVFQTHSWLVMWLRSFAGEGMSVMLRRDADGRLDAAAVFVRRGDSYSYPDAHSYLPGVLHRPAAPAALGDFVCQLFDELRSPSVELPMSPDDPCTVREVGRASCQAGGAWKAEDPYLLHAVDTAAPFADYLATRHKKARQELRRKDRKFAGAAGKVELITLTGRDRAADAFRVIERVESDSWKAEEHSAIISSELERRFYRCVLELEENGIEPRTYALVVDGEPAAFVTGLVYAGRYNALKTSYCNRYAEQAPGQVLFYRCLQQLSDSEPSVDRLELLGRDARWKRDLASWSYPYRRYVVYPRGLRTTVRMVADQQLRPVARDLLHANPRLHRLWLFAKRGRGNS